MILRFETIGDIDKDTFREALIKNPEDPVLNIISFKINNCVNNLYRIEAVIRPKIG